MMIGSLICCLRHRSHPAVDGRLAVRSSRFIRLVICLISRIGAEKSGRHRDRGGNQRQNKETGDYRKKAWSWCPALPLRINGRFKIAKVSLSPLWSESFLFNDQRYSGCQGSRSRSSFTSMAFCFAAFVRHLDIIGLGIKVDDRLNGPSSWSWKLWPGLAFSSKSSGAETRYRSMEK